MFLVCIWPRQQWGFRVLNAIFEAFRRHLVQMRPRPDMAKTGTCYTQPTRRMLPGRKKALNGPEMLGKPLARPSENERRKEYSRFKWLKSSLEGVVN